MNGIWISWIWWGCGYNRVMDIIDLENREFAKSDVPQVMIDSPCKTRLFATPIEINGVWRTAAMVSNPHLRTAANIQPIHRRFSFSLNIMHSPYGGELVEPGVIRVIYKSVATPDRVQLGIPFSTRLVKQAILILFGLALTTVRPLFSTPSPM